MIPESELNRSQRIENDNELDYARRRKLAQRLVDYKIYMESDFEHDNWNCFELDFVESMEDKLDAYGTALRLSEKQENVLENIIDKYSIPYKMTFFKTVIGSTPYSPPSKVEEESNDVNEEESFKPSEEGLRALARYKAKKKEITFKCVDLIEQFDYTDLRVGDIFCTKEKPYKVFVIAEIEKDKLYVKRIDHRHLGEPTGEFMHKVHILGGYYLKLILE